MYRTADHYRKRSQELRAEAARRSDQIASHVLLNLAEQCEKRANDLELRGPLNLPGNHPATAH